MSLEVSLGICQLGNKFLDMLDGIEIPCILHIEWCTIPIQFHLHL